MNSQREISPAVVEKPFPEEGEEEAGLRVKFFPFRNHHSQERIQSQIIYLTHVSVLTYDEQTLYIIKLTDTTSTKKPSKPTFQSIKDNNTPMKKAFNSYRGGVSRS